MFNMLRDALRDTWAYQEMMKESREEGFREGFEKGFREGLIDTWKEYSWRWHPRTDAIANCTLSMPRSYTNSVPFAVSLTSNPILFNRSRNSSDNFQLRATSRVILNAVGISRSSLMAVWKFSRTRCASGDHSPVFAASLAPAASRVAISSRKLFNPFWAAPIDSSVKLIFER